VVDSTIYSFIGPPCSGKGTLAQRCNKDLAFPVLSTGDLCRKHVELGTELGKLISAYLNNNRLIPDSLIADIVCDWIILKSATAGSVILDGFPRTRGQAAFFLDFFKQNVPNFNFKAICFTISDEEVIERVEKRLVCQNKSCQAVYSDEIVKNGFCCFCGSKLLKREDDKIKGVKERLKRYPEYKEKLLSFYDSVDVNMCILDVSSKLQDQVFREFKAII